MSFDVHELKGRGIDRLFGLVSRVHRALGVSGWAILLVIAGGQLIMGRGLASSAFSFCVSVAVILAFHLILDRIRLAYDRRTDQE